MPKMSNTGDICHSYHRNNKMQIKEIQNFDPCDLIQFLNQEARKDYQHNDKKDFFNAGVAFMLACVRKYFNDSFDIPIRDNNGWISVDDGLPDDESKDGYLVYSIHTKVYEKVDIEKLKMMIDNSAKITHCQPLPQPPKE